jgi:Putative adhesin
LRTDSFEEFAVTRFLIAFTVFACAVSIYGAETEQVIQKSVPVSAADHLVMTTEFGSIDLHPGTSKNIEVEVHFRGNPPSRREFDRMLRDFSLKVTQQGSEVTVNATFTHGWEPLISFMLFDGLFSSSHAICHDWRCLVYSSWLDQVVFRIAVPQPFNARVDTYGGDIAVSRLKGEVTAHTSGGTLKFDDVAGPVNASTSGGGIALTGIKGKTVVHTSGGAIRITDTTGDVDASTSGGSISIDNVSGRVKAHTSGGWIEARQIAGAIDASTSGGSVTASLIAQPQQDCRFYTAGGSIDVSLIKDAHVNLDASTSGGSVSTDFPLAFTDDHHRNELRGPLNGGGPLLYMHTAGGGINLHRAG